MMKAYLTSAPRKRKPYDGMGEGEGAEEKRRARSSGEMVNVSIIYLFQCF